MVLLVESRELLVTITAVKSWGAEGKILRAIGRIGREFRAQYLIGSLCRDEVSVGFDIRLNDANGTNRTRVRQRDRNSELLCDSAINGHVEHVKVSARWDIARCVVIGHEVPRQLVASIELLAFQTSWLGGPNTDAVYLHIAPSWGDSCVFISPEEVC